MIFTILFERKLLSIALSTIIVGTLFVGCNSKSVENGEKKYLIASDSKYAPFSFEEDGKYQGIDIEILAAVAEEAEFEYELKPTFHQQYPF